MVKPTCIVLVFLSLSQLHAQFIKGTVFCKKDSTSFAEFSTVFLLNKSDSSVITSQIADIDGNYKIKFPLNQREYVFYIHKYGFRPYYSSTFKSPSEGKIYVMNHYLEEELLPEVEVLYNKRGVTDISIQNSHCLVRDSKTKKLAADTVAEQFKVPVPEGCEIFYVDTKCYSYEPKEGWKSWADSLWLALRPIEKKIFNSNQSITIVAQITWKDVYFAEIEQVNLTGKQKDILIEFITNNFPVFAYDNYHGDYRPWRTGKIMFKFTRI